MEDWLYNHEIYNLKPSSFDRKENTCRKQIFPYIGELTVSQVVIDDIENLIQSLRTCGYAHSTIKKAYEAVNACFRYYCVHNKLKINPAVGVKVTYPGRRIPRKFKYYTHDQIIMIQNESARCYTNGRRVYPQGDLISILANTGIRVGELLALTWSDVDLLERTISIEKNAIQLKNRGSSRRRYKQYIQDSTKTSSSIRIVPLNETAFEAFSRLEKLTGGRGLVACSRNGKPLNNSNVRRTLQRILANINFPKEKRYGVHSLRHSFATALVSRGADIKKVSEILGHSSVAITYDYYVHFIPKDYTSTVELLDKTN